MEGYIITLRGYNFHANVVTMQALCQQRDCKFRASSVGTLLARRQTGLPRGPPLARFLRPLATITEYRKIKAQKYLRTKEKI